MLAFIPLLPFAGFLANVALGKRLSKSVSGGIACAVMVVSFLIAATQVWALFGMPPESRQTNQTLYTWITAGDFSLDLAFRLDALSAVMILVITGIGSLIHIYSTAYMHEETDPEYARYFSYLSLFVFFMAAGGASTGRRSRSSCADARSATCWAWTWTRRSRSSPRTPASPIRYACCRTSDWVT